MENNEPTAFVQSIVSTLALEGLGVSIITAVGPATTPDQLYTCIESVQKQEAPIPIEHILVFDGRKSAQMAQEVLKEYYSISNSLTAKIPIETMTIPWSGPGIAKMSGLKTHKYRYFMFLDADDEFATIKSVNALHQLITTTQADIVQGITVLDNGKVLLDPFNIEKFGIPAPLIESKREIFERCQVFTRANTWGKMFDGTKVALKLQIETDMCDECYGIVEAMFKAQGVSVSPEKIYVLHDNPDSISKSGKYEKLLAIRRYVQFAREFAIKYSLPLPDKYYRTACYDFMLFGKKFLRINKWKYRLQVLLFGKQIFMMNVGL